MINIKALPCISLIFLVSVLSGCNNDQEGCIDPAADNYDPEAEVSDGSCLYGNMDPNDPNNNGTTDDTDTLTSDITTSTTLANIVQDPASADYYVCGNIDIESDVRVEPGVTILLCSGATIDVTANGSLTAEGSASEPIVFKGAVETKGFWNSIHINSNNPDNVFRHVTFAHGGGDNYYDHAMVFINDNNNSQASFENVTFTESQEIGLLVENTASTLSAFSNNTFSDNGTYGIVVKANHVHSLDANSYYNDNNGEPYILVSGGDINNSSSWKATDAPYLISQTIDVADDLTINPGVAIRMGTGVSVDVESTGSLNAVGTSSNPISIKGEVETVGYWNTLHFNSNNPANELRYVEISDGGGDNYYDYSTIMVNNNNNASLSMYNNTISDSYGLGVYVENGASIEPATEAEVVSENTFTNNGTGSASGCSGSCDVSID